MNKENDFHISFFRPTTDRAKHNRNMVLWLISVWTIAIFGFQFLLKAIEKPTPEPELIAFIDVWSAVSTGDATVEEIKIFTKSTLHVAGKVFIAPAHREALDNGITWGLFSIADSSQRIALTEALIVFEAESKKAETITDKAYIDAKIKLGALANAILGLNADDVLAKILPLELKSQNIIALSDENAKLIEQCMPIYTIHNRSVLTDTTFLGFPFHYFYTAVLLLILFIGLCYGYCRQTDRYNKKIGIIE